MTRVVIDVNVFVSAMIGPLGYSRQVLTSWDAQQFEVVVSAGIVTNLEEKLKLQRITSRFTIDTPSAIRWLRLLLNTKTEFMLVPRGEQREVTGDPEDDYVLATARLAEAEYLVTGDKGLLALDRYERTTIVSPRSFVELLQREEPQSHT
jgi:uncharacterized protein